MLIRRRCLIYQYINILAIAITINVDCDIVFANSDKKIPQDSGIDSGVVTDEGEAKVNNQVNYS